MIRKAIFVMEHHSGHVHSNRFNCLTVTTDNPETVSVPDGVKLEKANFYIPKPLADGAKKIKVTIEVVE